MSGYVTTARLECPTCKAPISVTVEIPEPNYAGERSSDITVEGDVYFTCPECDTEHHAYAHSGMGHCSLELMDDAHTPVSADLPHYAWPDEPDYAPPSNPHGIYRSSRVEAAMLLIEKGSDSGTDLINRMVFAHYIAALEAFLADTLIKNVLSNPGARKRLLEEDSEFSKVKFSLREIEATPDFVLATIRKNLSAEAWHNLKRVAGLYRTVFKIDVQSILGKNLDTLTQAIEYRHDCVHRNGFNTAGDQLRHFTNAYVESVGKIIDHLVEMVDSQVSMPF